MSPFWATAMSSVRKRSTENVVGDVPVGVNVALLPFPEHPTSATANAETSTNDRSAGSVGTAGHLLIDQSYSDSNVRNAQLLRTIHAFCFV
jgi:hypothetical protein